MRRYSSGGVHPVPRPTRRRIKLPASRRTLVATPVFEAYWRFAAERQRIFHQRVRGAPPPWTSDEILANHRFTNAYRAADRVSQYLIQHVIYDDTAPTSADELFFRTIVFKLFNKVATWETLQTSVGEITWRSYDRRQYERILDRAMGAGQRVYSAAYIMPTPPYGQARKHANHLRLIETMMADRLPARIANASSLAEVYELLLAYPSIGSFLAFQLAIDLNYGPLLNFSEMDFVVAGPGAKRGIRKCFVDAGGLTNEDLIRAVADLAEPEFKRLGIEFEDLFGRSLQLIDCQNLFCEIDKYARVAFPDASGAAGPNRIKQRFRPIARPVPHWFPPKWGLRLHDAFMPRGQQGVLPFNYAPAARA